MVLHHTLPIFTSPCPGYPQLTEGTFHAGKRPVEQNPQTSVAGVTKMIKKNPRTIAHYLHALRYYSRAARRKPLYFFAY